MALSQAVGIAPQIPPVPGVIRRLFNEQLAFEAESSKILKFVGAMSAGGLLAGSYPVDQGWKGLSFSEDPAAATEIAMSAGVENPIAVKFNSQDFRVKRYPLGFFNLSDADAAFVAASSGFGLGDYLARKYAAKAADLLAYFGWTAIGTSGNYASGFSSDPGDITSPSFDFIGMLQTVRVALTRARRWRPGQKLMVGYAQDITQYLQLNTQIRARVAAGQPTSTVPTPDEIASVFAAYLPGAEAHEIVANYENASGTVVDMFSGKIAFVIAENDMGDSFSKLIYPGAGTPSENNLGSLMDIWNAPGQPFGFKGVRYFGDMNFDFAIQNNKAGYLAHTLLS